MNSLRVAIDVTPLAGARTGIGNFVASLAQGLATESSIECSGLAMTSRGRDQITAALPAGVALGRPVPARLLRRMWLRHDQPTIGHLNGPTDVVHGTNYVVAPGGGAAELVSVHDLSAWHNPESVTESSRIYPRLLDRALARGAHIHAISHFVAGELTDDLGVDKDRVHVVHLAADDLPAGDRSAGRRLANAGEDDRYLLAIGSVEPRKDYPGLVVDFAALAAEDSGLRLVIAGGPGFGSDALATAVAGSGFADRITLTGYVSLQDKADLLAGAELVVSTATYEGFGIVPVEAMAAGLPVVAVAGGSIPEVCGEAARLVDSTGGPMQAALRGLLADSDARRELADRGPLQAAKFSWDATVSGLVEVYQALAAEAAH